MGLLACGIVIGAVSHSATNAAVTDQKADPVNGQKVYVARKCNICHVVNGAGGKLGPDLSMIGTKRTAAWFEKYLPNPRALGDPKGKMPPQPIEGQDLKDIAAYLAGLKGKQ
jgi:mono/diheme cytochrome c family protein